MIITQKSAPMHNLFSQAESCLGQLWKKVYNCLSMIWVAFKSTFHLTKYKIVELDIDRLTPEFREKLKRFEASFIYPFSDREQFRIEHGKGEGDYFAFFKKLGKVHCYVALDRGELAAMACGVLRTVTSKSGKPIQAWYICDLKVGTQYRGEHLPLMLFQRGAWRYFQAPRGYGICMNPPDGHPKAAEIWRHHAPMKGLDTKILNFYTLTHRQATRHWEEIEGYFGKKLTLASTHGAKDYQIFGPNGERPWQLLHFRAGEEVATPQPGYTHMLSAVSGSPLDHSLNQLLGAPTSTAEIVSFGMDSVGFNFLTSDQI